MFEARAVVGAISGDLAPKHWEFREWKPTGRSSAFVVVEQGVRRVGRFQSSLNEANRVYKCRGHACRQEFAPGSNSFVPGLLLGVTEKLDDVRWVPVCSGCPR